MNTDRPKLTLRKPVVRTFAPAPQGRSAHRGPKRNPKKRPVPTFNLGGARLWHNAPDLIPNNRVNKLAGRDHNLTGRTFGRMRVAGLLDEPGTGNKRAKWVVQCNCGNYELRSARAIKNAKRSRPDMCRVCNHLNQIAHTPVFLSAKKGKKKAP